jgi:ABC-type nitrate/sulfonate/bicarbonate transport system substrate-binding protein
MRLATAVVVSLLSAGAAAGPALAADAPVALRVAQQPQRWALEWYIATQKNWWKQIGLEPTTSIFASGAPEIAAGASGSWDVGGAGNIPSVLGAARYGLMTIGIADEEAAIITIMATKDKADDYAKNPSLIKGKVIPVTTNSTGHWGAAVCLEEKFGLKAGDYKFVNLSPPEINAAVTSGRYDLSEVWAPNTYILESSIGAKIICTGRDVGLPITSNLFALPSYAKDHQDAVAKFLAVYLRAVAWQRKHPEQTVQYLSEFFKSVGVNVPEQYMPRELRDRPAFTLAEQLKIFKAAADGKSDAQKWSDQVAEFMKSVGIINNIPDSKAYVTDKFLLMIESDPKLKAFADSADE